MTAENPTVFFANALGDHLLNLPALRALCELFPTRLTLVTGRGPGSALFDGLPFRKVIRIAAPLAARGRWFDARALAEELGGVDWLLSLNPWHSDAMDEFLEALRPRHSIGFFPPFEAVIPLDFGKHAADLAFDLVRVLDGRLCLEAFAAPPLLPEWSLEFARAVRQCIGPRRRLLAVHGETKPEKSWHPGKMARTIQEFAAERNYECIVLGERGPALHMEMAAAAIPAINLPLLSAVALIAQADLFLGVDSFPLHAADLAQVPGLALFGPTNPDEFGFRFSPVHRHMKRGGSLDSVQADEVIQALGEVAQQAGI